MLYLVQFLFLSISILAQVNQTWQKGLELKPGQQGQQRQQRQQGQQGHQGRQGQPHFRCSQTQNRFFTVTLDSQIYQKMKLEPFHISPSFNFFVTTLTLLFQKKIILVPQGHVNVCLEQATRTLVKLLATKEALLKCFWYKKYFCTNALSRLLLAVP